MMRIFLTLALCSGCALSNLNLPNGKGDPSVPPACNRTYVGASADLGGAVMSGVGAAAAISDGESPAFLLLPAAFLASSITGFVASRKCHKAENAYRSWLVQKGSKTETDEQDVSDKCISGRASTRCRELAVPHYKKAMEHYSRRRYQKAVAALSDAYRLFPHPSLIHNSAEIHRMRSSSLCASSNEPRTANRQSVVDTAMVACYKATLSAGREYRRFVSLGGNGIDSDLRRAMFLASSMESQVMQLRPKVWMASHRRQQTKCSGNLGKLAKKRGQVMADVFALACQSLPSEQLANDLDSLSKEIQRLRRVNGAMRGLMTE